MTQEAPQRLPEQVWFSLSEQEKQVCKYLSGGSWSWGFTAAKQLNNMGISEQVLFSLVDKGIVEEAYEADLAQQQLNVDREQYGEILRRLRAAIIYVFSRGELRFLEEHSYKKSVLDANLPRQRYRLFSPEFHDWVKSKTPGK